MWVGICGVMSASLVGVLSGRVTDYIFGQLKLWIILLLLSSAACFSWFLLITLELIPFSKCMLRIIVYYFVTFFFL